jgi:SAM-dependent methyltransferase
MAFHVGESFVPGTVTSLKNLGDAAFETPNKSTGKPKSLGAELTTNLTGIKFSELDIDAALKYSISEYRAKESDIISVSPNFVRESSGILQRYDQREKKRRDLQVKLYEKVQAAEVLLGSRETSKLLRKHGMSRPERRAILNGQFLAREPSKALLDLIKEKTPFETEDGFKELRSKLREQHRSYRRTSLIKPLEVQQAVEEEDRLQRAVGGVVSTLVPNAPVEPDERINKLTGVPYNEEAGPAYMDETDPMRVLNMAAGGRVRKGKGGKLIELFMKKPAPVVAKSADEFVEKADDYLANSASKTTQRANTVGTATKASKYLDEIGAKGRSLDYGAGKGLNAEANKIDDTFEPFPEETFSPTFVSPKEVPENTYGKVISTNVINVLPPNLRKEAVTKIGKSLKPGGKALIQTWDAGAAKAGMASKKATVVDDEPLAFTTSTGSYQKGFTNKELEQYVTETLGEGFEVSAVPSKKGISGVSVVITRKPQRLEKNKGGKVLNTLKRNCSK